MIRMKIIITHNSKNVCKLLATNISSIENKLALNPYFDIILLIELQLNPVVKLIRKNSFVYLLFSFVLGKC